MSPRDHFPHVKHSWNIQKICSTDNLEGSGRYKSEAVALDHIEANVEIGDSGIFYMMHMKCYSST